MLKALFGLFALSTLIVAGCARSESPRRPHAEAGPSEVVSKTEAVPQTGSAGSAASGTASGTLNGAVIGAVALTEKVAGRVLQFQTLLAPAKLEAQSRQQSATDREELYKALQQAAETVEDAKASPEEKIGILKTFSSALLSGCSHESQSSTQLRGCRFLNLFKGQTSSVTLALAAAQSESNTLTHHDLLGLAYTLTNRYDDNRIDVAYIRAAKDYELAISAQTAVKESLQTQHAEVLEHALARVSRSTQAVEEIRGLLEERYDVFNLSAPRPTLNSRIAAQIFTIGAKEFIRSERWRKELANIQARPSSTVSLYNEQLKLRPRLPESLGLPSAIPASFETFIFELVWSNRLSVEEASRIFEERGTLSEPDKELARTALLHFAMVRFFLAARQANDVILNYFAKPGAFVTEDAFRGGLREGAKGQTIWADAIRRIEMLKLFRDRNLADTSRSAAPEEVSQANQRLNSYFSGIDQNIRLVSTFPSMLVLSYHLARLKFSLKVFTWTGLVEIHAGRILEFFFSGGLTPWFAYSNDRSPILASQIPIVVHYALELGMLSGGGVDLATFVSLLATQMAGALKSEVETIDRAFEKHYELDPRIADFNRICKTQEQRMATHNPRSASPSITLDQVRRLTIAGMPEGYGSDAQHSSLLAAWTFYGMESTTTKMRLDENLEVIRLEYSRTLERIQHTELMIKTHLERHGVSGREQTIASMRAAVTPLENLKKQVYSRIFRINKSISHCGELLAREEIAAQKLILLGLESHLRDVYRAMGKVRSANASGIHKEFGFAGAVAIPGLDEHETKLGYTKDDFRVSKLQLLLRARSILENGFRFASGEVAPPKRDKNSIQIPARLRDVSESLRSEVINIEWHDTEELFVSRGLRLIMPDRDALFFWPEFNAVIISIRSRIRSLSALAKAGVQDTDEGPQSYSIQDLIRSTLEMEKWLDMDDTWKRVLNLTGRYSRFSLPIMLDTFAWGESDQRFYGLLDSVFAQVIADKLGENQGDEESARFKSRVGAIAEFKVQAKVMRALGQPMLTIPTETLTRLDQLYRQRVDMQLGLTTTFLNLARQLEERRRAKPETFPSWRLFSSRPPPAVPMLSAMRIENHRAEMAELSRETGYILPEGFVRASGQ